VTLALEGEAAILKSTPVPLRETDWGLPVVESSLNISVPARVPVTVGVNVTFTVQLPLTARVEVQVFV
jgi:hypothetical protein